MRTVSFNIGWHALLLISLSVAAFGKGYLELSLIRYHNREALTAEKKPCDISGKCALYFLLEIDGRANASSDSGPAWPQIETDVYRDNNGTVTFGSWLSQYQRNPVERIFEVWTGVLNLKLHVRHSTSNYPNAGDISVDTLTAHITSLPDATTREYTAVGTIHGSDSFLVVSMRVECQLHYFPQDCSKYCEPHDDYYGHYECAPNGDKLCRANWRDLEGNCLERDFCAGQPCQNDGVCTQPSVWDYACACPDQFIGHDCEKRKPPCDRQNPCRNGGSCINVDDEQTTCLCTEGWTGSKCEQDRNECLELPCSNGGRCRNLEGGDGFLCDCDGTGFQGRRCMEDVDECTLPSPVCRNNGTCRNKHGSYKCACSGPFYGKNCAHCNSTLYPHIYCPEEVWLSSSVSSALVPAVLLFLILMGLVLVIILKRRGSFCRGSQRNAGKAEDGGVAAKMSPMAPAFENRNCASGPNGSARNGQIPGGADATMRLV